MKQCKVDTFLFQVQSCVRLVIGSPRVKNWSKSTLFCPKFKVGSEKCSAQITLPWKIRLLSLALLGTPKLLRLWTPIIFFGLSLVHFLCTFGPFLVHFWSIFGSLLVRFCHTLTWQNTWTTPNGCHLDRHSGHNKTLELESQWSLHKLTIFQPL